jgi:glucose-6-phosphate 1-dehydrogenase
MEETLPNPLREGLSRERTAEPCALVIFGASGDLTRRKLVPGLFNLALDGLLGGGFSIVGFARREKTDEAFAAELLESVNAHSRRGPADPAVWRDFAAGIRYVPSPFENPEGYRRLAALLDQLDRERGTAGNRIFYLATPPSEHAVILAGLKAAGLGGSAPGAGGPRPPGPDSTIVPPAPPTGPDSTVVAPAGSGTAAPVHRGGFRRIVVEKPFGRDLRSAEELNRRVLDVFAEREVFRIDHYLGKETVQNILVFRFANGIFEPIWNQKYVDHVQITVGEDLGVERRGSYFEEAGILRDMIQNHVLQLLTLVAMEPPVAFDADAIRDEKVKVLRAVRPIAPGECARATVRGQYGPGSIGGRAVPGYREEEEVAKDSVTETFAALRLHVDTWRWGGVPFYLRAGKRLPKRVTEIAIQFRRIPHSLFRQEEDEIEPNVLALRIQPDEGISLRFGSKIPGPVYRIQPVKMDFRYGASFGAGPPEAYERLLLDCMLGDSTLFTRKDEVERAWEIVTAIREGWDRMPAPAFPDYEAGSWGPAEADELLRREGRAWRKP